MVDHRPVYITSLANENILFVNDILDCDGNFFTYNYIHNLVPNLHFLEYMSLVSSTRAFLKQSGYYDCDTHIKKLFGPILPLSIFLLFYQLVKEVANFCTTVFSNIMTPTAQKKFENLKYSITSEEWQNYYRLPLLCMTDNKLSFFSI